MIFAPLCLVSIIILWYIIISRQVNAQVAFFSSLLIIPAQIVEISITPNSFAILLMLTALVLYTPLKLDNIQGSLQNEPYNHRKDPAVTDLSKHTVKHNYRKIPLFAVMAVLVFTHPVNAVILLVMVSVFYSSDKVFSTRYFGVSLKGLIFLCLLWVWWLVSITVSGGSLIQTLYRMISTESAIEVAAQHSQETQVHLFIHRSDPCVKICPIWFFALLLLLYAVYTLIHYKNW